MCAAAAHEEPFNGFPRGVQFTPVPNPLLAGLLEQIDDLAELKVTLRVVWAINQKKGHLRPVTASELCADRTVAAMLGTTGEALESEVTRVLERAVERGTLLEAGGQYFLNTQQNRSALERGAAAAKQALSETRQSPDQGPALETVFNVYEENIGPLTPMIGERITTALGEYGEPAVRDAIGIAAEANARNWSYISAVLKRMAEQGQLGGANGEPGRDSAEDSDARIQRYLERHRQLGDL